MQVLANLNNFILLSRLELALIKGFSAYFIRICASAREKSDLCHAPLDIEKLSGIIDSSALRFTGHK